LPPWLYAEKPLRSAELPPAIDTPDEDAMMLIASHA